jgi:hypothetical protein
MDILQLSYMGFEVYPIRLQSQVLTVSLQITFEGKLKLERESSIHSTKKNESNNKV